jgi:hypothetical protein
MRWARQAKTEKRNKPISALRAHGRKLRCRASTFLASPRVRQRSVTREAASVGGL